MRAQFLTTFFAVCVLLCLSGGDAVAQDIHRVWRTIDIGLPGSRDLYALEWSPTDQRLVLFGGRPAERGSIWLYRDGDWRKHSGDGPAGKYGQRTAVEPSSGRVFVFGGVDADDTAARLYTDFSVWDGTSYTPAPGNGGPSNRSRAGFSYDIDRGVLVLFGGHNNRTDSIIDTWEYSDEVWERKTPTTLPPAWGPIVYDPERKTTIAVAEEVQETWEWDGEDWSLLGSDAPEGVASLVYHAGRGEVVASASDGLWTWDGTSWQQWVEETEEFETGWGRDIAYHPGEEAIYGFGGRVDGGGLWRFADGKLTRPTAGTPSARHQMAYAWDSATERLMMYGGGAKLGGTLEDTWTWKAGSWSRVNSALNPGPRANASMAFDAERGVAVLTGGAGEDTRVWEFDGTDWSFVQPPNPLLPYNVELVYSELHERVLAVSEEPDEEDPSLRVFGWTGSDWERLPSMGGPSRREFPAVWDSKRDRLVFYSGRDSSSGAANRETWAWDTEQWSLIDTEGPAPDLDHAMVYVPERDVIVMLLRSGHAAEFDGSSWTTVTSGKRIPRSSAALFYDTAGERVVAFGGWHDEIYGDLQEYVLAGAPCEEDAECESGFCSDGVCCDQACGAGNPDDCFACSAEAGASVDGLCAVVAEKEGCESIVDPDAEGPLQIPEKSTESDGCCATAGSDRRGTVALFLVAIAGMILRRRGSPAR